MPDFKNLHSAYLKARRGKRYRTAVLGFGNQRGENLLILREKLLNNTYRYGGYREFVIADSKRRVIKAALFRDRVVYHAFGNVIEPIFKRSFIFDSYACRKGKGVHRVVKRLENFIKSLRVNESKIISIRLLDNRPIGEKTESDSGPDFVNQCG